MAQDAYDLLHQLAAQVIQVFLENTSQESTHSFVAFLISNPLPDGSSLARWLGNEIPPDDLKCHILLGFAAWIDLRIQSLDRLLLSTAAIRLDRLERLSQYVVVDGEVNNQRTRDLIFHLVLRLLGSEFSCFATALAALSDDDTMFMLAQPARLLAFLVNHLERCRAKVQQVAMELSPQYSSSDLTMKFCRYFTVDFNTRHCLEHETGGDVTFQQSPFGIQLIDSYSSLLMLLEHMEQLRSADLEGIPSNLIVAVDFEGVKLNRSGQLCLLQITCSDQPSCVYVLDVYHLPRALHFQTPDGTSLKAILEDMAILKVWFDPRNDVDALFHQFGIVPQHIFDLQLADVAARRSKGLQVNFVPSLQKCLSSCDRLDKVQKTFADFINKVGKQLFEPDHGGCYEVFRQRPLLEDILVYAAHDCMHMQLLYNYYCSSLSEEWNQRVLAGSRLRGQWFAYPQYLRPSTDAPDF